MRPKGCHCVESRFVVSACLAGVPCRYDGRVVSCPPVVRLVALGRAVPACPEWLGGLSVPRPPCELCQGRVCTRAGGDLTAAFVLGAQRGTALALRQGCTAAILKSRSPSCGLGQVYDGTFSGALRPGDGLWGPLLQKNGLHLFTEENLPAWLTDGHF